MKILCIGDAMIPGVDLLEGYEELTIKDTVIRADPSYLEWKQNVTGFKVGFHVIETR
jgi:hypothetical protein